MPDRDLHIWDIASGPYAGRRGEILRDVDEEGAWHILLQDSLERSNSWDVWCDDLGHLVMWLASPELRYPGLSDSGHLMIESWFTWPIEGRTGIVQLRESQERVHVVAGQEYRLWTVQVLGRADSHASGADPRNILGGEFIEWIPDSDE